MRNAGVTWKDGFGSTFNTEIRGNEWLPLILIPLLAAIMLVASVLLLIIFRQHPTLVITTVAACLVVVTIYLTFTTVGNVNEIIRQLVAFCLCQFKCQCNKLKFCKNIVKINRMTMDKSFQLSERALETIMNGGNVFEPIVQVLGSKKLVCNSKDSERYRLILSDGKFKISVAMCTIPSNDNSASNGTMELHSILKLKRYITNVMKNKNNQDTRILLILKLEVLAVGSLVGGLIGNPVYLTDNDHNSQSSDISDIPIISTTEVKLTVLKKERFNCISQVKNISPISSLNPFHNNWIIKARVLHKSNVKHWRNLKGEGKLFTVDLVDKSGEIRCTAFRELVDAFYNLLEVDKVYFIAKCILQPNNPKFSFTNHRFEMTFCKETLIVESLTLNEEVPKSIYNFNSIDKIATMAGGTLVDVIAICKSVSDVITLISKSTNRELKKRELLLVDQSKIGIFLVFWNDEAEFFSVDEDSIIAVKNALIKDFQGSKSLTSVNGTLIKINPDLPESFKLKSWYENEQNLDFKNLSMRNSRGSKVEWMRLKQVQSFNFSNNESSSGFYFKTFATILLTRMDRLVYKSCPMIDCQKKVIDLENGMFRCEKCNREYGNFKYRLIASMNISDDSGNQWVTLFASEAEKILGKTSQEIGELGENGTEAIANILEKVQFNQYVMTCKATLDFYNDEQKLRVIVVSADFVRFEEYNKYLMEKIAKFCEDARV